MTAGSSVSSCAVVVVHFGEAEPTLACLAAIRSDPSSVARDIVVVDNSDSLPEAAETFGVRVVRPGRNLGYGAGVNAGVAALGESAPDAVVFMNHDVEIAPGFLDAAVAAVALPGVGAAAGPLFLDGWDGPVWYAGGGVNVLTGTVRQCHSRRAAARAREVGFLTGTAVAVRSAAFRAVGGFDPAFFLYNEDLDLSLRLRRQGWRLWFEPAMGAIHRLGTATGSRHASPLYLEHLTRTRLRPFRPLAYRLYLAVVHSLWVLVRAGALASRGKRGAAAALFRGHLHALATVTRGPVTRGALPPA